MTGSFFDSDQDWYHGQLTRAEAEQALRAAGHDSFLIRESKGAMVLSLLSGNKLCHIRIKYGPGSYMLEAESVKRSFSQLKELIAYYRDHSISERLAVKLGKVCKKKKRIDLPLPASDLYEKGCPSVSDKAGYHGDVSRVEAEQGCWEGYLGLG